MHLPRSHQERVIEATILGQLPDLEGVAFDDDGQHVHLIRPDDRIPAEEGGEAVLRCRLGGNARRYLLGEVPDEQYAGLKFELVLPSDSG